MNKLITIISSVGFILLCCSNEAYAVRGYAGKKGGRGSSENSNMQYIQKKDVKNHSNQPQQESHSDIDNIYIDENLVGSLENLAIGENLDLNKEEKKEQEFSDILLNNDNGYSEEDSTFVITNVESEKSVEDSVIVPEHHELQDSKNSIEVIESSIPQDFHNESDSSLPEVYEQMQPVESKQQVPEDTYEDIDVEIKQEIKIEEELVDVSHDEAYQVKSNKLFEVIFNKKEDKEVFAQCNNYQFCEFMLNALGRMTEPETVSMVRHYGFGLGHVPLLLVWSSHLFDRLEQSRTYCMETQDLKDILMLILIIDLRAQVDAACIEHMKKNSHSRNALAVQTDNKIIEQSTECAPRTAAYLKRKLATLWGGKIREMYGKKKLPCYSTILQKVKDIANQWQDDQLQSPIWVCCVMHKSYMLLSNLLAAWPAERFGNWWNPQQSLITACQGSDYSEIRKPKTDEVLVELEEYASWPEYFGDISGLVTADDAEYDSDGDF